MELGKAYFSMELGISIIPAGECCKWSRNCRLDDNRYTEERHLFDEERFA
jgi:hypothetical protein